MPGKENTMNHTRSFRQVNLLSAVIASSVTSTAAGSAVDLAPYFNVGKREVKFVVASMLATTSTGFVASVTIQECDTTSTADFTNVVDYAGSTLTATNTDATHYFGELNGIVTKRYVRALYNAGQATTGNTITLLAAAFPFVRAM
jgi:hypothetical protein